MTDQDQDNAEEPGQAGLGPTDSSTDVEGHAGRTARVSDEDDDVEGHFGTIRSTGSKGE